MGLPWVRMDTSMPSHDKILALLSDPSPKKWQAVASYTFAIMWSGAQGTDGRVPTAALPFVHGTPQTARLLVKYGLWIEHPAAYEIKNYAERQQLEQTTAEITEQRKHASAKANCIRWHGINCGCWRDSDPATNGLPTGVRPGLPNRTPK